MPRGYPMADVLFHQLLTQLYTFWLQIIDQAQIQPRGVSIHRLNPIFIVMSSISLIHPPSALPQTSTRLYLDPTGNLLGKAWDYSWIMFKALSVSLE